MERSPDRPIDPPDPHVPGEETDMTKVARRAALALCLSALAILPTVGCGLRAGELEDLLDDLDITINNTVNQVQTRDPRSVPLPEPIMERGDTVVIEQDATVITSV